MSVKDERSFLRVQTVVKMADFLSRILSAGEDWVVERRPNDFYSLDVKLTEFHGPLRDAQLPTRKLTTSRAELIQVRNGPFACVLHR